MTYFTKVFNASLDSMEKIIPWIISHIPESIKIRIGQYKLELAFEELIINIYEHAYKKDPKLICIFLEVEQGYFTFEIRDFGPKFNLLIYKKAENRADMMPIGGQGLKFIKAALKEMKHSYNQNMNIVTCEI